MAFFAYYLDDKEVEQAAILERNRIGQIIEDLSENNQDNQDSKEEDERLSIEETVAFSASIEIMQRKMRNNQIFTNLVLIGCLQLTLMFFIYRYFVIKPLKQINNPMYVICGFACVQMNHVTMFNRVRVALDRL